DADMISWWLLWRGVNKNLVMALFVLLLVAGPMVVLLLAKYTSRYPKAFGLQQVGNAENHQKHR
ncbi:YbhQ family protein, partial [Klebsiella pneumoniae]|uniref:YbhQ family protein n=1 Tax=Klebsiella pneumoniae TaxID=573 RepID=UPI002A1C60B5